MMMIIRTLKQWFRGKSRKESLCSKIKQRYIMCLRECMVPPFSYIICHETCIKDTAEEYGLSIKKVEKCLNK